MSYPEPPHYQEMGISPESYSAYSSRSSHEYPTTMAYEHGTLYSAETPYMYNQNGRSSPGMYPDDSDVRGPASDLSIASASSSNVGSPLSSHGQMDGQMAPIPEWASGPHGLGVTPGIVDTSDYHEYSFAPGTVDGYEYSPAFEYPVSKTPGFVDPILIHPDARPMMPTYEQSYPAHAPSAYPASPALSASPQLRNGSASPFMPNCYPGFSPFQPPLDAQRRPSIVSYNSNYSPENQYSGDESKEKQRCPHPECGKVFKDLKAHMLTHQEERPEKCPIATCEYHVKGFARKYDKNRHTLTHYKGTMVCGFCPGSGSAAEKSFNRADVFKRHLTAVHGVEQTPPNSRKKAGGAASNNANKKLTGYAPDATGKCSTCSQTFSNAQDFYEHLDDCVLRIVQQEDPAEAINAKRLAEVENDREVVNTLEKNNLPTATMTNNNTGDVDDEDENMEDGEFDEDSKMGRGFKGSPSKRKGGNPANGVQKSRGMTHSRGGYSLPVKTRGRKNRRDYPSSWGFDKGQMTMKKRVMAVFDGARRLHKDDMMLSTEQEVRIKLSDGKSYVTDLDLQTLKRAEGYLNATPEEKGPWVSDDLTEEQIKQMLALAPETPQIPAATAAQ
ncbi:hypothetical protein QBC42DRAFT_165158 [Cladorrhinum samala]|uniref:C2H2-type domain-containing protein n=1 Tax=Cladorrhinum samala TaxID=585594 RepID=A0AAV9I292_9PEZI|nr:hypothetical protein QBC42DRAFT_165158 [Cladorrhinum samala]